MQTKSQIDPEGGIDLPPEFTVQVCSDDGRLLREYALSNSDDNICTVAAAERRAVRDLSDFSDEKIVIIVSQQTLTKLRQIQLIIVPADSKTVDDQE